MIARTLRVLMQVGLLILGGYALWTAIQAQSYWAPLPLHEKQWEPGWDGYIQALKIFGLFLVLSIHIPAVLRWWWGRCPYTHSQQLGRPSLFLTLLGLTFVFWLAQSLRFYDLEQVPPGLWLDEGINVMDAERIRQTGEHSIYLHSMSTQRTALFVEILAQTLNWDWPSRAYAVRGTAALLGFVNVILMFCLGWRMFSLRMGLLFAFLLTVAHWHLNYSRWGMEQILSPLFEVGALASFFTAYSLGSWRLPVKKSLAGTENAPDTPAPENPVLTDSSTDHDLAQAVGSQPSPSPKGPGRMRRFCSASASTFFYLLAGLFLGGGIYAYSNFRLFLVGLAIFFLLLPFNWLGAFRNRLWWLLATLITFAASLGTLAYVYLPAKSTYQTLLSANQLPLVNGRPEALIQYLVRTDGYLLLLGLLGLFVAYLIIWRVARTDWYGFALMVITAAVVLIPFTSASLSDWWAFTKRAAETSVFNMPHYKIPLQQESTKTILGMHWEGDANGRHNLTHAPQLSPIPAALCVLGILYALATVVRPTSRLLLLWVFFGLLPGMVTWEAPHASRMLDALPPLLILAALAWREVFRAIARIPWAGYPLAVGITLIGCFFVYRDDYRLYFVERPNSREVFESFLPDEVYAAKYAGEVPQNVTLFVDPQLNSKHNFWFYQGPHNNAVSANGASPHPQEFRKAREFDIGSMPLEDINTEEACFVVMRTGAGLVGWLKELYPSGRFVVGRSPWGEFNFAAVHVTRGEIQETYQKFKAGTLKLKHGLLAKYYLNNDLLTQKEIPRLKDWNLLTATQGKQPTRIEWEGYLWKPFEGPIHFGVHPQNVTVEIDHQAVLRGRGVASREDGQYITRNLAMGLHPFKASYDHQQGVRVPYFVWMLWRAPGSNLPGATPFPGEFFSPAMN